MNTSFIKKIRAIDVFLIVVMTLFSFACLFTLFYNQNINYIKKLSNHFYDEQALFFNSSLPELDYESVYEKLPNDSVFYGKLFGYGNDIRGLIYKGDYAPPYLESGRFFLESDFTPDSRVAVVGREVEISKNMNGKKYISYNHMDYEVIGTIGYTMPTRIDRTILVNLNPENITSSIAYIISSSTTQIGLDFLGNEEIFGEVVLREKDNVNILHLVDGSNNQVITSMIFILVIFVNSITVILFWVEKKKTEMFVKWNNGYTKFKIIMDIWKSFLPILLVCLVIALVASFVLGTFNLIALTIQPAVLGMFSLFLLYTMIVVAISYIKMARR